MAGSGQPDTLTGSQVEGPATAGELPEVDPTCYEMGAEIGRGGLGQLYRARDRRLGREVAVKQLYQRGAHSEARFRREARITARLQHPSIVPVHEAGRWPSGEPFYAMKLVQGRSLKEVVAERAGLDDRLALLPNVLAVAEAMAYAHNERVIHRDLKPSNVMVGAFGETVVIDWGLAKEQGAPDEGPGDGAASPDAELTQAGRVVGTAPYMPPEQARGEPVDQRADVYALGAILYYVLTGRAPYDGDSADQVIARVLAEPPREVAREVPRELGAVVAKAMARAPAERYPSAAELAADLKRFLTGQLVSAHRYSLGVLLRRWVRRHRQAVLVGALALVALGVLAVTSVRGVVRARDRARAALAAAEVAGARAEAGRAALLLAQADAAMWRDPTLAVAWLRAYASTPQPDWLAIERLAREAAGLGVARRVFHGLRRGYLSPDGRELLGHINGRFTIVDVEHATRRELAQPARYHTAIVRPPWRSLLYANADGVSEWPFDGGPPRQLVREAMERIAVSRDGAFAVAGRAGQVVLIDLATGQLTPQPAFAHVAEVDVAIGGKLVKVSDGRGHARLQVPGGASFDLGEVAMVPLMAPAGNAAAWIDEDDKAHVWRLNSAAPTVLDHKNSPVVSVVFSEDGTLLATISGSTAVVWDVASLQARVVLEHARKITGALFSPDHGRLVTVGAEQELMVWDLVHANSRPLRGHRGLVRAMGFSASGTRLVSSDAEGEVRVWDVELSQGRVGSARQYYQSGYLGLDWKGRLVANRGERGLLVWDVAGQGAAQEVSRPGVVADVMAMSRDGRQAVTAGSGVVSLWDLEGGTGRGLAREPSTVLSLAFSPDAKRVGYTTTGGVVALAELVEGQTQLLQQTGVSNWHATFSPDGRWLACAGEDTAVRVFDLLSDEGRILTNQDDTVYALAFSPDGKRLISAGGDTRLHVWPVDSWKLQLMDGHHGRVWEMAFVQGGERLLTASDDRTVREWDLAERKSWQLVHRSPVVSLDVSPDERLLVTGGLDGVVAVWELASRRLLHVYVGHQGSVMSVLFGSDGSWVASAGIDGTVRAWPVRVAAAPGGPQWLADITSAEVVDGRALSVRF